MRVLHVISGIDPQNGGPPVALRGLAEAQRTQGMSVRIVSTYQRSDAPGVADAWRERGLNVDLIGPATGALSRHPQIRPRVRAAVAEADVVHIHALWEEIQHQAAAAARGAGVPYIVRPCGMLAPWSLAQSRWRKKAYMLWRLRRDLNGAAALHFTSQTERDQTAALRLKAPGIVEPNGIDLAEFDALPPAGTFRSRLPHLAGRKVVLFFGRIHPKKGLDLLIPAFAAAPVEARLVIAGPDADGHRAEIERLIRRHNLADRVTFTGLLSGADRLAVLRDADLFVLPSYQENFGNAVVESLAAGTPVIVSDQVNIHDTISANRVGVVVPTQIEPLAQAMTQWLTDDDLRRAAAERCRPFALTTFDWRKIADRWCAHYRRMSAHRE